LQEVVLFMKLSWPLMRVVPQLVPSELETYVPELKSPWQAIHPFPAPSFHVGYACALGAHMAQATRALITAAAVVSEQSSLLFMMQSPYLCW
jgi:hypothetical protein